MDVEHEVLDFIEQKLLEGFGMSALPRQVDNAMRVFTPYGDVDITVRRVT